MASDLFSFYGNKDLLCAALEKCSSDIFLFHKLIENVSLTCKLLFLFPERIPVQCTEDDEDDPLPPV